MTLKTAYSIFLIIMVAADSLAQVRQPMIEQAKIVVDKHGRPKNVLVDFKILTDFKVAKAILYYQDIAPTRYKHTKMKLTSELSYRVKVPFQRKIIYYIELKREAGPPEKRGDVIQPFILDTASLPSIHEEEIKQDNKLLIVVVVIVSIFSTGLITKAKK